MQEDINELLKEIERMREQLKRIADNKELTDPKVVAASQMLDAALNEYYKLVKDKV
ncbi:Spo0E family sporulation regulatory protein-aspartic acid phosphatase [Desulfitobacterium sp. AusDCA]|uniref:Spo0E family sporulation regulatory protein-aspartic acid phosphatase n=1 Tax=Desulfitobacterium sp. AusDCA TaxID=3240383 RepID=UPI003DA77321